MLVGASPGVFFYGTQFFEFAGTLLNPVPGTPHSPYYSSFPGNMLTLPTGQVLYVDSCNDVEIYTAPAPLDAWRPTITSWPASLSPGQTFARGHSSNALFQTVTPTAPVLTSIAPPAVSAGSPSFTMTLNGNFFGASAS